MAENLIIYRSKKKASYIILAAVLLLGASYLSFAYANDAAFGWIFIIAAAFIFILGVSGVRDRRPQIILTETGLTEPFPIGEEIEWDAIAGVDDFFYRGQDIVRIIVPRDYKPDLVRPTWFRRLDPMYARQGVKAMYIRVRGLEINSKQLTTVIENMVRLDAAERSAYLQSVKKGLGRGR